MATARIVTFSLADLLGLTAAEMDKKIIASDEDAQAFAIRLTREAVAVHGEERQAFKNGDEVRPKKRFRTGGEARCFVIDTFEPVLTIREDGTACRYDMRVGVAKPTGLEIHPVESIMFELVPPEEKPANAAAEPDRAEPEVMQAE